MVENLDIQNGLVNGTSGILKRILFDESNQAEVLIIEFESYCGPAFFEDKKLFPLRRSERRFDLNYKMSRVQFPVKINYAMTIHKS